MNSREAFRSRYESEVQPEFNDKDWHSFEAYRSKRKKRIPVFIFWTGISIIAGLIMAGLLPFGDQSEETFKIPDSTPAYQIKRLENTAIHREKIKSNNNATTVEAKKNEKAPTKLNKVERTDQNQSAKPENKNKIRYSSHSILPSITEYHLSETNEKIEPLARLSVETMKVHAIPEVSLNPIIMVTDKHYWPEKQFDIGLSTGLSIPTNVKTIEEKAHQFNLQLIYNTTRRLRYHINFGFQSLSFISNQMDEELGIQMVAAPSEYVVFSSAIVESSIGNMGIGADVLLFSRRHFRTYAGITHQLALEINKDIDYTFNGKEDFPAVDEITLSRKNKNRFFTAGLLRFESGLEYSTKTGVFNLSLGYPVQLSTRKINLLNQVQFNFGVNFRLK
ncbi:MAG: hypothetical protein KDC80_10445 [Saprospiraceae bacterium]|nr:hypothetical protein [Saprospiraceae bacterium]